MRTWAVIGLAVGLALGSGLGCRGRGAPNNGFHILSKTPSGQLTEDAVTNIAVVFDRPMVAEAAVGKPLTGAGVPFTLSPAVAGSFQWKDPQTVIFAAQRALPRSTQYSVQLTPALRAQDGTALADAATWSFTSARLTVLELLPKERRWLTRTPRLMLHFSQAVAPTEVAHHCRFTPTGTAPRAGSTPPAAVDAVLADGESPGVQTQVPLLPARPLLRGQSYRLSCAAELHGTEGPLGLASPYAANLSTYGDLKVVAVTPSGDAAVAPDELEIVIEFSNPVDLDEVRQHLSAVPDIAKLTAGSLDSDGHNVYRARVDVEAETSFHLEVGANLKDVFGQKLAEPYEARFVSLDAKPRLSVETGAYAVEADLAHYPLWTRNLHSFEVEAARIPDDQLVALLSADYSNYREWRDEEARERESAEAVVDAGSKRRRVRPPSTWAAHKLAVHRRKITLKGVKNKWQDTALDIVDLAGGGAKSGVYGLTLWSDEAYVPDRLKPEKEVLVNVTNIGLLAKLGPASSLVWAVHLSDGKVAPGVKVEVRNHENEVTFSGTTSADGTVELPGKSQLCESRAKKKQPAKGAPKVQLRNDEPYDQERAGACRALVVIAREGTDLAVLPDSWSDGVYLGNFNLPHHDQEAPRVRGFLQTDRGLYRPGEMVHIKGLARQVIPGQGLRVPTEKSLELVIKDPKDNELLRRTVPITPFGGFSVDVPLTREAVVGDYQIVGTIAPGASAVVFRDRFLVEEYRVATFAAKLSAAKTRLQLGEHGQVSLQASYLYGAPLTGGQVHFEVRRRDRILHFASFAEYTFTDLVALEDQGVSWWRGEDSSYSMEVSEGEAKLDGKGRATFPFDTQDPGHQYKTTQDFLISARVTDEASHVLTTSVAVVAHRSLLYLGIHAGDQLPRAGQSFPLSAVAVDQEGKPSAAQAELVVSLRSWECGYADGERSYSSFHCAQQNIELSRRKVALSASGPTNLPVTVDKTGTILLSLRMNDGRGHEVVASEEVYALGPGETSWRANENGILPAHRFAEALPAWRYGAAALAGAAAGGDRAVYGRARGRIPAQCAALPLGRGVPRSHPESAHAQRLCFGSAGARPYRTGRREPPPACHRHGGARGRRGEQSAGGAGAHRQTFVSPRRAGQGAGQRARRGWEAGSRRGGAGCCGRRGAAAHRLPDARPGGQVLCSVWSCGAQPHQPHPPGAAYRSEK